MSALVLHGYWRSSATYRVRIALALKGLAYDYVPHDLRKGAQHDAAYLALNPLGLVPALEADGQVLTQSIAIIEWLEEAYPAPPLLPSDPSARAEARALVALVACDIQPLANLRVQQELRREHGLDQAAVDDWSRQWIARGFEALEVLLARHEGAYALGDTPGAVDCVLVPQAYNAERAGIDLSDWPRLAAKVAGARAHPAFIAAAPENQPDAGGYTNLH